MLWRQCYCRCLHFRDIPGKILSRKDYVAYLFTYFTGNSGDEEAVRYAVSMDGYTYWALNDNEPVIDSKVISSTGESATRISFVARMARLSIW